ncbi:MAG: acyltransferase [Hahellaceae bacterium]|nr:acyltransferase [Hahellaceae bacterium]MCP5211266.1 acyltransferase [Hahellaceae bacterium]
MSSTNLNYRRDLQGLRAVAIILVVLAHARIDLFYGGFVGVDVFFVLSGFLISGILFNELSQQNDIGFIKFYSRRLKRLLPALLVMVLISFVVGIMLLSGSEARSQLVSAPFALTWTSNLLFAFANVGYFDELASRDLFLHTWSLGVEEQFYLIWPILLLFLHQLAGLRKDTSATDRRIVFFGLFAAFCGSLLVSIVVISDTPTHAFYQMPARIWQFSLGAIIWLALHQKNLDQIDLLSAPVRAVLSTILLVMGLALVMGSALVLSPSDPYPGYWVLIPSLGAACIILAGGSEANSQRSLLNNPVAVWIGDRAYSLYLWHWPVFTLGFSYGFTVDPLSIIGMCGVTLLLASISYHWIELPFWRGKLSQGGAKKIVLTSLLLMAISVLLVFYLWRQLPKPNDIENTSAQWRSDVPAIYQSSCDAWYAHAEVQPCVYAAEGFTKTVVIFGDSIGVQWFSLIPEIFKAPSWRTVVLTKSSCAIVDEDYYYERVGGEYKVCRQWRDAVLNLLDQLTPDIVFMGSASTYDFTDEQWLEGTSRILARIHPSAKEVVVIPGTPSLTFDGPGCVERNINQPQRLAETDICVSKNRAELVEPVTDMLVEAAERFDNVSVLNTNDFVCPSGDCRAVSKAGIVVFRDSQHLTDTFVRSLIPQVKERLNSSVLHMTSQAE